MYKKPIISQEDMMKFLDDAYEKCKSGIPYISKSVTQMADEYLSKNDNKEAAIKDMISKQIVKCTTSGVITGLGGFITMPVAIPANIGSVLYVQMRMIACTAYMSGYDINSDQVQTFVYACLAGVSINELLKKFGIQFGEKLAIRGIQKIPGRVLVRINQKIGMRFVTKFGEKGLINLGKMIPVVGAAINGSFDFAETKIIASRAYKWFVDGDISEQEIAEEMDIRSEEAETDNDETNPESDE